MSNNGTHIVDLPTHMLEPWTLQSTKDEDPERTLNTVGCPKDWARRGDVLGVKQDSA